MKIIFLVGMPGSGKTYWAQTLAEHYKCDVVDMDRQISILTGKKIATIFKEKGEAYFREMENGLLQQIIKNKDNWNVIVACGGGTPSFNGNMELMLEHGCVIYLKTDINVLEQRLLNTDEQRPLLEGGLRERLETLYELRKDVFEQAHYTINTNSITIRDFENIIALCTKQQ